MASVHKTCVNVWNIQCYSTIMDYFLTLTWNCAKPSICVWLCLSLFLMNKMIILFNCWYYCEDVM
uniref:Uncharacterized protein n=1 Tax=Oryza brachyantha TaxID=4533 RepID=J3LWT0_ORYBR